jgi:hypothetical protein
LSTDLQNLDDRIGREIEDIERTFRFAADAWESAEGFPSQRVHFLNSLALNLHSFYNGLERIFETIARGLDPTFPSGERWHHNLLEQMAQEIPGVRPAVLSAQSVERLDEFLAFRHRVRNLYGFNLEAKRLRELLERLPAAWQSAKADVETFRSLLQQAASSEGQ